MRQQLNFGRALARLQSIRLVVRALSLAAMTSCSSDAAAPVDAPQNLAGRYALADVGGNRVPVNIYDGPWTIAGERVNVRIDVVGSELELDEDGFYSFVVALKLESGGKIAPLTISDEGEWELQNGKITFASDDPESGSFMGTLSGGTVSVQIDLVGDGHPPVYRYRK